MYHSRALNCASLLDLPDEWNVASRWNAMLMTCRRLVQLSPARPNLFTLICLRSVFQVARAPHGLCAPFAPRSREKSGRRLKLDGLHSLPRNSPMPRAVAFIRWLDRTLTKASFNDTLVQSRFVHPSCSIIRRSTLPPSDLSLCVYVTWKTPLARAWMLASRRRDNRSAAAPNAHARSASILS